MTGMLIVLLKLLRINEGDRERNYSRLPYQLYAFEFNFLNFLHCSTVTLNSDKL